MRRPLISSVFVLACVVAFAGAAGAQGYTQPAAPAKDKQAAVKPAGPAPVHDITGVWMRHTPKGVFASGATFTKEEPDMTPWALAKYKEAKDSNGGAYTLDQTNDPVLTRCYPPGVPRVYFHPYPFEFVQTPKYMMMVYEYDHIIRRIYTDNRKLPEDPDATFMGTSVGRWDGATTFVVDSVGFNEKTWLDRLGHPHSEQLHVTERFRRVDRDHLELDISMQDPKALVKPWTTTLYYELRPEWELAEITCSGDYLDFNKFESFSFKK
jgi:hypothetical protein